jgi:Eukaryotic initiation factor 4E
MESHIQVTPLENTYTLYYHDVNNDDWGRDSYRNICTIRSVNDFVKLYNTVSNYTSGMFFIMRDPIFPLFEDDANLNGGFWTYKISKKDMNKLWFDVVGRFLCNQLTRQPDHMKYINGISISPKISNCILKIWNSDSNIQNEKTFFKDDVNQMLNMECHYRPHVENMLNFQSTHTTTKK